MQHHFAIPVIIVAFLSSSLQAQQQDATLPFDPLGHSNFVNYWWISDYLLEVMDGNWQGYAFERGQNSASESGQDRSAWQKVRKYTFVLFMLSKVWAMFLITYVLILSPILAIVILLPGWYGEYPRNCIPLSIWWVTRYVSINTLDYYVNT